MTQARTDQLQVFLDTITFDLQLGGRIRFAQEGLNCTISGTFDSVRSFASKLSSPPPSGFGAEFKETDFKYIDDLPHDRSFKDLRLLPVKELVFYGLNEDVAPLAKGGVHLPPKEYHAKMKETNTVIVDVRNSYEAEIGKFVGQEGHGGATYIDPKMRKSTDFTAWLDKPDTQEKLKGKQVLLYCTGGVRCERASALLNHKIGNDVKGIYQLHGGIEKYLQEFPDGGYWKGLNYVFDKREAIGAQNPAGVGGVVASGKKTKKQKKEEAAERMGRCCTCNVPWERFVGKKKCYTCGVPVLMCDSCMTHKIEKNPARVLEVRCPLCKEENITVPAAMTVMVDNGKAARPVDEWETDGGGAGGGKAASSVIKWGGGDQWGSKKKAKRMEEQAKHAWKGKSNAWEKKNSQQKWKGGYADRSSSSSSGGAGGGETENPLEKPKWSGGSGAGGAGADASGEGSGGGGGSSGSGGSISGGGGSGTDHQWKKRKVGGSGIDNQRNSPKWSGDSGTNNQEKKKKVSTEYVGKKTTFC
jgi:predicted sulfurtransferase